MNKIKRLAGSVSDSLIKTMQYLVFYFYFYKLRIKILSKYIYQRFISPHLFRFFSIIYFLFIILISLTISAPFSGQILAKDGVTFFTAVGAMLGGVLAIVFSLSTLLMQNAAQHTSAGFYNILGKDKVQIIIFWIIAIISFIFFVLAVVFSTSDSLSNHLLVTVARLSIILIGFVLWLLYVLYIRIYERIRPISNIEIIKKDAFNYMDKIKVVAEEVANVTIEQPKVKERLSNEMALAASFQHLKRNFDFLNIRLDHLFDYHDKLLSLQEKRMARLVLDAAYDILVHYFHIRSTSSIIVPLPEFFFVGISDSQDFLTPNLENFVSKGNAYIKDNDNVGITHVIKILSRLAISAINIKYISNLQRENPIFTQCRGYLDQLMDFAIKNDNTEALYQGVQSYGQIGAVAIDNSLLDDLLIISNTLYKIACQSLLRNDKVVWREVINTYIFLLRKLLSKSPILEIYLKSLFEQLQGLTLLAYTSVKSSILENYFIQQTADLFLSFRGLAREILNKIEEEGIEEDRENYKNIFISFVEQLRWLLRNLSKQIKSADHFLVGTFGKVIADIRCLLLEFSKNEDWEDDEEKLIDLAEIYLNLPPWFVYHAEKINDNMNFDALVEAVTKIGIQSFKLGQYKTAKESIQVLSNLTKAILEKGVSKHGFTEPRIMEKACYVGILALKLNENELVDKLKEQIRDFQESYETKWFSNVPEGVELTFPKRNQLQIEIIQFRDKVREAGYNPRKHERRLYNLDRSADRMVEEIGVVDIDKFTLEVWNFIVSGSPLENKQN